PGSSRRGPLAPFGFGASFGPVTHAIALHKEKTADIRMILSMAASLEIHEIFVGEDHPKHRLQLVIVGFERDHYGRDRAVRNARLIIDDVELGHRPVPRPRDLALRDCGIRRERLTEALEARDRAIEAPGKSATVGREPIREPAPWSARHRRVDLDAVPQEPG